jgi:hypothetical protein
MLRLELMRGAYRGQSGSGSGECHSLKEGEREGKAKRVSTLEHHPMAFFPQVSTLCFGSEKTKRRGEREGKTYLCSVSELRSGDKGRSSEKEEREGGKS